MSSIGAGWVAASSSALCISFTKFDGPPEKVRVLDPKASRAEKCGSFCFYIQPALPYTSAMNQTGLTGTTDYEATSLESPDRRRETPPVRVEIFVDASNFQPGVGKSEITHPIGFGKLATKRCRRPARNPWSSQPPSWTRAVTSQSVQSVDSKVPRDTSNRVRSTGRAHRASSPVQMREQPAAPTNLLSAYRQFVAQRAIRFA